MTETTPLFMDINDVYSGDELGLPYRDIVKEGVVGITNNSLKVSQRAAGANLSVDVAAGACWVKGDTSVLQPMYRCYNDAVVNKGITPDPTNPRYVAILAQVTDEGFTGSGRNWQIVALHGTPAGSPTQPATPASAIVLAYVLVGAADTSITDAEIVDQRREAVSGFGGGCIHLLPETATLPDGTAGNLAAGGPTTRTGTEANPKKRFKTLDYDGGGNEEGAWWTFAMPEDYHGGGGGLHVLWMANATSGNCRWHARVGYTHWSPVPADTPLEHATVTTPATVTTVNAVEARRLNLTAIAMLGDANNDSMRAIGLIHIGLFRNSGHADDTMTVDAEVMAVSFEF